MPQPSTYVALLKGINVGGNHLLPMKELVAIFVNAGCTNVRTYIQSGNVLFNASASVLKKLPKLIMERIAARFGFQVPVVIRTTEQLARTIRDNPFHHAAEFPKRLYVCFLADVPDPIAVGSLDPDRSPPHAFRVLNGEIYLHLPGDAARTKLTAAYFDAKLSTISTARNWNTVCKILELMQA